MGHLWVLGPDLYLDFVASDIQARQELHQGQCGSINSSDAQAHVCNGKEKNGNSRSSLLLALTQRPYYIFKPPTSLSIFRFLDPKNMQPSEQRHIIRIVAMIPVYSIISFLSYRFYKEAIYYETIRDCYEAFVLYSFFVLLLTYLGDDNQSQRSKMTATEKRQLPFPLSCYFYNPLGDMFLHKMKWGILQYVVIKPTVALVSCVLHYYELLCPASYSWHFGNVYLTSINFVSASVSLYCLVSWHAWSFACRLNSKGHQDLICSALYFVDNIFVFHRCSSI